MSLFLAAISALAIEVNSWVGYSWYWYYRVRYTNLVH